MSDHENKVVPVLLVGGRGERFWPRSRQGRPKQFLPVTSEKTMLEETVERIKPLAARIVAVTSEEHLDLAREFFDGGESPIQYDTIAEVCARSTAPALGLAAIYADPDEILIALPADHYIPDVDKFRDAVRSAAGLAKEKEAIVCFGITPTRPETGYGYIRPGKSEGAGFHIDSFVEKPPKPLAETLLSEEALWNGGIFVVRAGVYLDLVREHVPELAEVLERISTTGEMKYFSDAPTISVDHGILEHTDKAWAIRADFVWDDVGDWGAMSRIHPKDPASNAIRGDFVGLDSGNLVVDTDNGIVATIGVSDLLIIRDRDVVLVVKRGEEQKVRELLAKIKRNGMENYL